MGTRDIIGTIEMKLVLLILFILFVIIVGPVLTIWALNTLFPMLAIPYTWQTLVSAVILGGLLKTKVSKN